MKPQRIVALVVVLTLSVGTLVGAFRLSTTGHGDLATLRAAAAATLDAPSYRVTAVVQGKASGFEEYVAPDRIRSRFARVVTTESEQLSPELELIDIGTTSYAQQYCPADGEAGMTWSRTKLADPEHATPFARYVTTLIESANDARLVATTSGVETYEFTPTGTAETEGPHVELSAARATIAHGRLVEVTFSQRVTGAGDTQQSRPVIRFSRYGRVRPIEAPADSIAGSLSCKGGTALGAAS